MNDLIVDDKLVPRVAGWHQLGPKLGGLFNQRIGWRLEGAHDGLVAWNDSNLTHIGPRSILSLRFGQNIPAGFWFPGHGYEDFRDGGLHGISPCGDDEPVTMHDRIMARCPLSIADPATGKNPLLANVEVPHGGYVLERVGPQSILPGFGKTDEIAYDGQHIIRMIRVAMRHQLDPFVQLDLKAIALDCALAWDRARAQVIFSEPRGEGSPRVGREWAWASIAAVLAGHTPLIERMRKIASHVQSPYGNLQVNSGGNPAPPPGTWFSDMEAHFQVRALMALGMKREAAKLANVCARRPIGKYIEVGTGRGSGPATVGTAWAAIYSGVFGKVAALDIAKVWPIPKPTYMGGQWGPFPDRETIRAKLIQAQDPGKFRDALEGL